MTKKFGIIGNPIKHSLSPILHNYWFEKYKSNPNLRPSLQIHNGMLLSAEVGDSLSLPVTKLV